MVVKLVPLKALSPIFFTVEGIVIDSRLEQPENADFLISSNPSGNETSFKLVLEEKAPILILLMPLWRVTLLSKGLAI